MTVVVDLPSGGLGTEVSRAIEEFLVQEVNPAVSGAQIVLARALEGHHSPCREDPDTWTRDVGTREGPMEAYLRARRVQEGCLECSCFVQCSALADTLSPITPEITGFLAGRMIGQSSATALSVSQRLGMEMQ